MSHGINIDAQGNAAFFSYRVPAWHELGNVVNAPATLEEAQQLSRLTWTVEMQSLTASVPEYGIGEGGELVQRLDHVPVETHKAVRRTDTGAILGVVGADWTPVQNDELFAWLREIGKWGELQIETAGALGAGETVWVLSRMDSLKWEIDSKDVLRPYLLLSNGFDGKKALGIAPSYERVVCANTMRMAQREIDSRRKKAGNVDGLSTGWKLHHTADIAKRMEEARLVLQNTTDSWKATQTAISRLIDQSFDESLLDSIVKNAWKLEDDKPDTKQSETRQKNRVDAIRNLLDAKTNVTPSAKGTLWGAYNAITEFVDHDNLLRTTAKRDQAENRFINTQFGRGDVLKTRAWNEIQKLLKPRVAVSI